MGPLGSPAGSPATVQRLSFHGFELWAQQAGQGVGGKQHPLLVDEDHGIGPFSEQRQQPLLILMQPGLQAQAMLYLLLEQVILHQEARPAQASQQGPRIRQTAPSLGRRVSPGSRWPGVEALFDVLGLVEGGEQQHRQLSLGCCFSQAATDVEAGERRHHHIQQDEIHRLLGQLASASCAPLLGRIR